MKMLKLYAVVTVVAAIGFPAFAGITYEGTNIIVSNYPASFPATLSDIRTANDSGGWGIVQYDPETDTTTLTNHLLVGGANGTNTFFQIGRTNYPAEILVIKGNLRVKTPSSGYRNGLLMGTDVTNTVCPVVKFNCATAGQYGLYMESGTVLTSYNAVVTSATTNRWYGGCYDNSGSLALYITNTMFSNGTLYPFYTIQGVIANCTFANAPFGIQNSSQYLKGCIFSNLEEAIVDYGGIQCTLVGCTFTNNYRNWGLQYTAQGIRAVDCWIGTPGNTNIFCQRYFDTYYDKSWHYPSFLAQRHFVVCVTNSDGAPITNATVEVSNEQHDDDAIVRGIAVTGTNGLTPAIDSEQALFVKDYLYRATAIANQPFYQQYTYTLTTTAPGYGTNVITGVNPDQSWTTLAVTLTP